MFGHIMIWMKLPSSSLVNLTVALLAKQKQMDCELSLEEHMACAIGGCAGCTVMINENGDERMKRVCVDGPVFKSEQIYF